MVDAITQFYQEQFPDSKVKNNILQVPCPFCAQQHIEPAGTIVIFLNKTSYFHGYFRCTSRCVPGGFPLHFARLKKIRLLKVPGFDPDREYNTSLVDYPIKNLNGEVLSFMEKMTDQLYAHFSEIGISRDVLEEMKIGYNGRYLVYPYIQDDGNCYAAHCIHPDKPEDNFWYGDEKFSTEAFRIFNGRDISHCENGSLVITEGEDNLLALKQLGLPCIALPSISEIKQLDKEKLQWVSTLFLFVNHNSESETASRLFAELLGYKVRLVHWPEEYPNKYSIKALARDNKEKFQQMAFGLIKDARSFSPFGSPEHEHLRFNEQLQLEAGSSFESMQSGFPLLDKALGGIHGINIMGGTPKAGKSCFFIQLATNMARQKVPVIYYDFENGRQKIYLRTLSRLSQLSTELIKNGPRENKEKNRLEKAQQELKSMLPWFRVVTDRKLNPELMRRHIDFLRHETHSDYTLVVIDSLHKLPFKDFSERRTGIDAWLRQLEAIRDELNVSFLVISELSRGTGGQYDEQPHMGSFKGSGDIEYSADNAMVLLPKWDPFDTSPLEERLNDLWLVASREQSPGRISSYRLDFPYWGFVESG